MLTRQQLKLLTLIRDRLELDGISPSYDEMKDTLNLKSKSGIHRLICSLEERGYLRRLKNRARALQVVKFPEQKVPPRFEELQDYSNVHAPTASGGEFVEIPLMGRIAAGTPIEAISHRESAIPLPPALLSGSGEHFALKVSGDSMIDAGIYDDDTVVIRRQSSAENGDIVVAFVRGEDVTLKRFRRRGTAIALEAANPGHEPRVYPQENVEVQGKLVGLIRTY